MKQWKHRRKKQSGSISENNLKKHEKTEVMEALAVIGKKAYDGIVLVYRGEYGKSK